MRHLYSRPSEAGLARFLAFAPCKMVCLFEEVLGKWHLRHCSPGGIVDVRRLGPAPEIEVGVHAVFIGVQVVHKRERYLLGDMPQALRPACFVRENDIKENGSESHRVESDFEVDPDDVGSEHGCSLPDLVSECRSVG